MNAHSWRATTGGKQDMKLGLVSCTKSKRNHSCKAYEMYSPSALFKKAYCYSLKNYDIVAILSSKYGLLLPDDEVEPYDLTLKTMSKRQRREWASEVFKQMKRKLDLGKIGSMHFHTGKEYREYLIPLLEPTGIKCVVPLEGLSFGRQLAWYNAHLKKDEKRSVKGSYCCLSFFRALSFP